MGLRDEIHAAQTKAMKERSTELLNVLRVLWSALRNEEINVQHELSDTEVQTIIARQVKQLQDAITDFRAGGREDLIKQNENEIAILKKYLPEQLSDEELEVVAREVLDSGEVKDPANMGQVMGAVMQKVKGRADGNRVRAIVQKILAV